MPSHLTYSQSSINRYLLLFTTLLLILLICSNCSLFSYKPSPSNDELTPYVTEFIQEGQKRLPTYGQRISDFNIEFGDLPEGKAGSCKKLKRLVTINPDLWSLMDSVQRQALVFHELAHCVLDRDHNDNVLSRGECVSLMVGRVSDSTCYYDFYSSHWKEYYLDELFGVSDGVPHWYHDNVVLSNEGLTDLVKDTSTINHFNWRLSKETLEGDYQITIDSFNQHQLISGIYLRWASYSIEIDIETKTLEVQSLYGADKRSKTRHIVPRVFQTDQIPDSIMTVNLRSQNGFYDIYLNNQLAYRSSAHTKEDTKREMMGAQLYSDSLRILSSSLKVYLMQDDKLSGR